jgi:hypothetical protein
MPMHAASHAQQVAASSARGLLCMSSALLGSDATAATGQVVVCVRLQPERM